MNELLLTVRQTLDEWLRLRWSDLQFGETRNAVLLFVAVMGAAAVAWLFRHARTRRRAGDSVTGADAYVVLRDGQPVGEPMRIEGSTKRWTDESAK